MVFRSQFIVRGKRAQARRITDAKTAELILSHLCLARGQDMEDNRKGQGCQVAILSIILTEDTDCNFQERFKVIMVLEQNNETIPDFNSFLDDLAGHRSGC
jgi:hypothetical protein